MSSYTDVAPARASSLKIARATASRGASSSTKRSPSASCSVAPSPRTASEIRKPSRPGEADDRGRVELGELEVGQLGARGAREHQPGAEGARRVGGARPQRGGAARGEDRPRARPSRARRRARRRAPPVRREQRARGGPRAPRSARARRRRPRAGAGSGRPVALPPACATRRAPWPPSSPSARWPWRSASKRTPSASRSRERAPAPRRTAPRRPSGARARARRRACPRGGSSRRVVDGERGGQAALRPVGGRLGERPGGDQRDLRALARGGQRREEPGRAGADHDEIAAARSRAWRATVPACPPAALVAPRRRLAHDMPGHPERARADRRARGRDGAARLVRLRARRGAARSTREQLLARPPALAHRPRSRRCARARRRRDRRRHLRRGGHLRGGAARARAARSRWSTRCSARARRSGVVGAAAARATTPSARARWASASSTTSRSPRARARVGARRRARADPRLGRPPRQRDERHLPRRPERAVRLDPRVAAVSGHRARRGRRARAPGRASRSTCRCPAGSGDAGYGSLVEHVVVPLIARLASRSSCSCRRASTPTATTRWRPAG